MVENDDLYKTLLNYGNDRFLLRGDKCMTSFLRDHLNSYLINIEKALNGNNPRLAKGPFEIVESALEPLKFSCEEIPEILRLHNEGCRLPALERSFKLLNDYKDWLLTFSLNCGNHSYYRVRAGDHRQQKNCSENSKAALFHIPANRRHLVSPSRFCIPGWPSLYLSTGVELAWFECGMPRKFSYCRMKQTTTSEPLQVLDLARQSSLFLPVITSRLNTCPKQGDRDLEEDYQSLTRFILTYPVYAACSVRVRDRHVGFIEEYSFPEMVMQWIRETGSLDGVCYRSARCSFLFEAANAFNVALPVKEPRPDGLDKRLTKTLELSDIGYFEVANHYEQKKQHLSKLRSFHDKLQSEITEKPASHRESYYRLIEICENIFEITGALLQESHQNPSAIFSAISALAALINLIKKYRDDIIENDAELQSTCDEFCQIAERIIEKNAPFHFDLGEMDNYESLQEIIE